MSHLFLTSWLALAVVFAAAVVDLRTRHIPNWLLGWGSALILPAQLALSLNLAQQPLLQAMLVHTLQLILGGLLCALVPLLLFRLGAMGGGDVKLLAFVGAVTGPACGIQVVLWSFVLMAVYALGYTLLQRKLAGFTRNLGAVFARPFNRLRLANDSEALLTGLPFGPAVFAAMCLQKMVEHGWL